MIDTARFADPGASDLSAYDCVFLCDVPRLSEREVARLETHLQRGGGLVICLGPDVDLEAYNRLLYKDGQGLLPAKLDRRWLSAPADGFFYAVRRRGGVPATAAGRVRRRRRPGEPHSRHGSSSMSASKSPPGSAARRVLGLVPMFAGPAARKAPRPAARPIRSSWNGRGTAAASILITSTVNTDWTSWPIAPSFPPFVQELFRFAVAAAAAADADCRRADRGIVAAECQWRPRRRCKRPTAGPRPCRFGPNRCYAFRFADTDQSGLYRVRFGGSSGEKWSSPSTCRPPARLAARATCGG